MQPRDFPVSNQRRETKKENVGFRPPIYVPRKKDQDLKKRMLTPRSAKKERLRLKEENISTDMLE
ncbi:24773_t:CDS:2 [Cetraspora pellucida]|uniref:24773_t:CDS:1 n=1 Tax=Cetraspora pellucida TaxID=1433469 RepID=A0A9N9FJM9_9GLOM|nr:24773_t:CDS:2 [Cetraspora pellucida]